MTCLRSQRSSSFRCTRLQFANELVSVPWGKRDGRDLLIRLLLLYSVGNGDGDSRWFLDLRVAVSFYHFVNFLQLGNKDFMFHHQTVSVLLLSILSSTSYQSHSTVPLLDLKSPIYPVQVPKEWAFEFQTLFCMPALVSLSVVDNALFRPFPCTRTDQKAVKTRRLLGTAASIPEGFWTFHCLREFAGNNIRLMDSEKRGVAWGKSTAENDQMMMGWTHTLFRYS